MVKFNYCNFLGYRKSYMEGTFLFINDSAFMPHGHCYFWEPFILWSHAISDSIIALAYFIIPISLVHIVRKRNDFKYMWMLVLFAIFILGCGATHVLDVINIWEPFYMTDSIIRIITALASVGTALMLIIITPHLILMPSADKWKKMNHDLAHLNAGLEQEIENRTSELTESVASMKFLTDTIPQIVWTANSNGDLDYYNDNWYTYTRLTEKESLINGWQSAIHPDDLEDISTHWLNCVHSFENFQHEFRLKSGNDGLYRWFLGRALPMKDDHNTVLKWFGTATDIHDQKEKSEEVIKVNEELDRFIYTASHDLKAPITNLEGLINLLEERSKSVKPTDNGELFQMMNKQIEKLKLIIHDLSDIGQIKRASRENFEMVNIRSMVHDFIFRNEKRINESQTEILLNLEKDEIYFSPEHLQIILFNLLDNALKYSKFANHSQIHISSFTHDHQWELSVKDNGIGIEAANKEKIFEMFKRFSRHKDGTGMGLYIVKTTVEKYKGKIDVDSYIGKGSTFKISIPSTLLEPQEF